MKKIGLILIVLIGGAWWWMKASEPHAPLVDGLYLTYREGRATVRVSFSKVSEESFSVSVTGSRANSDLVNTRLRDSNGQVFEVNALGPIWIPAKDVKVGGKAHGASVGEVRRWKSWDVGVVNASFGVGGALRGTWYYDRGTGFLVGMKRSTAGSPEGSLLVLADTNGPGLKGSR